MNQEQNTPAGYLWTEGGPCVKQYVESHFGPDLERTYSDFMRHATGGAAGLTLCYMQNLRWSEMLRLQANILKAIKSQGAGDEESLIHVLTDHIHANAMTSLPEVEGIHSGGPVAATEVIRQAHEAHFKIWRAISLKIEQLESLLDIAFEGTDSGPAKRVREKLLGNMVMDAREELAEPVQKIKSVAQKQTDTGFRKINFKRNRAILTEALWPILDDQGVSKRAGSRIISKALFEAGVDDDENPSSVYQTIIKL